MKVEVEVGMATADDCRAALQSLTARIADMDAKQRERHLIDRTISLRVSDLGVTFLTRIGQHGADPIREASDGDAGSDGGGRGADRGADGGAGGGAGGGQSAKPAQVRFTAKSDDVVAIAANPGSFLGAWMSGRIRVDGNFLDLLQLRRLI